MVLSDKKSCCLKWKILSGVLFSFIVFSCNPPTEKQTPASEIKETDQGPPPPPDHGHDTSKMLKEAELITYIKTASNILPSRNTGKPFDTMNYDKIIAYDFEGSEEPYPSVINRHGIFVPVILKQQALTRKQADQILSALSKKSTYGEVTAFCFNPHFALVFFNNNAIKHKIDICLDCNYLQSTFDIPAETYHKIKLDDGSDYPQRGFTTFGKKAIIELCKELGFFYGQFQINE